MTTYLEPTHSSAIMLPVQASGPPLFGETPENGQATLNPDTGGLNVHIVGRGDTPATGQQTMADSSPVVIASDQSPVPVTLPISTTANTPSILTSGGDDIIPANAARKAWGIINLGTNPLYVRMANGATTSAFHFPLKASVSNDDGNGGTIIDEIYKGVVSVAGTSPRFVVVELT